MVEPTYGRRRRRDRAACCIDREIVRLNPDLFEHCAQQCGLVLTIAVPMNKDFRGGMWLPVHSPSGPSHSSRQILCWHHRLKETGTRPSVPQRPSKMASSFPAGWLSCHSPPIAIGYYRRKSASLPRGSATPPCTPNPERAGAYSGLHVRELCPETSTGPAARRVCP